MHGTKKYMRIKNGKIEFNTEDKKDIEMLLKHATIDLSYDVNGSYGHNTGKFQKEDAKRTHRAIKKIQKILYADNKRN